MKTNVKLILGWSLGVLLALGFSTPVSAGPVDAARAGDVARAFFKTDPNAGRRMATVRKMELYEAPMTKAGETAQAFHVFTRDGGGFVIVAGDDLCKPILAYSYDSEFGSVEEVPALKAYLADFEAQVALVRAQGVPQSAADLAKAQWMSAQYPTKAGSDFKPEVKHQTALFNQSKPFNLYCPTFNGKEGLTGCVPTAMCIIMRFFQYPAAGTGSLPSYSYEYQGEAATVNGFDLGHAYEWDKIKLDYTKGYTQEESEAVSRLMYDVGVAAQAWYLSGMTDTNFWRLIPAVIEHFGYDPNVDHIKRMYFTDEQWMEMIKGDLQDHPLIYAAGAGEAGHAFVVDGYDKKDFLSINWGWEGKYNGYFALSAFTPTAGTNYKYEHTTVLGLVPDKGQGGQPEEYLYMNGAMSGDTYYHGMYALDTPVRGKQFKMGVAFMWNGGLTPISGKYFFALTDSKGDIVEKISEEIDFNDIKPLGGVSFWGVPCNMSSYPMEGDKITLFYRSSHWPEGVWKEPLYYLENPELVKQIDLTPDGTKISDATSLSYDNSSKEFVLKTMDRVEWTLKNSSGSKVAEGISKDFSLTVPGGQAKGAYTLTLKRGKESQVITLKMGK